MEKKITLDDLQQKIIEYLYKKNTYNDIEVELIKILFKEI